MSDEVVIVGAGIVGLAVAFHLQGEGRRVRLVERGAVADGASRGNAGAFAFTDILPLASPGMLRKAPKWLMDPLGPLAIPPSYLPSIAPWLFRFWRASRPDRYRRSLVVQGELMRVAAAAMEAMVREAGLGGHVRADGNLQLYESEMELAAAQEGWDQRAGAGIEFEHVRGGRLAELQPGLSPRFVAGTFTPHWKTVDDPYHFALALFDGVMARGAAITHGEVTELSPTEPGVRVTLRDGTVLDAARAVLAGGAWSRPLTARLGDAIPLETERGYNTTLPPGAFDLRRQLTFGGHGFVVTPLSTGIRVGGAVELGGLKLPPNFRRSEAMLNKAAAFLPGLRTGGGAQWMGFRPSIPDSLPVIGPSRASRHIVYAFGHGHLGLTQSAATGRLVADLLADRTPSLDIAPLRADRF
ncbi:NAD(P)/FAD-dependent oxidoreductase [Ancylobacter defluvii]|uniref:D-amino-acid dehydrogenase n=1 Tax=Ancylobacter defluvii TaxID=1282440 RepID=A0A9W6NC46_9HYPH|nr:FAD-binding oxidoreductase [Ancylobacter defluvii]MBS7587105.1 FAD-binding oxidoreductase [Ancylobacter defluvii]GLK85408.1 D-amino-acid dehydrogenase [Ancylobacter defluvii]